MHPETLKSIGETLALLLGVAVLLPLAGFAVEIFSGLLMPRHKRLPALLAVGCIVGSFVCSAAALWIYTSQDWSTLPAASSAHGHPADEHGKPGEHAAAHAPRMPVFTGVFYPLAKFGSLEFNIDYYIDSLTIVMFAMVTLIAACIHVFALGYMSDEITDAHEDHQVNTRHGHFVRPGRYGRFFAYFSLFSFSMLGLVLAGNVFLVFVFWELVGICSYFLIGFYFERRSASTAANKAFIMNRVGDFGFLIGLMILFTSFGTFQFGTRGEGDQKRLGLFDMVRGADGQLNVETVGGIEEAVTVDGKVIKTLVGGQRTVVLTDEHDHALKDSAGQTRTVPYMLLIVAGLGVFAGCVGKSAQFPLQTWLPDAMEGPTPVSALVHSATMVAAGVYLAGRFFPVFVPEVLLAIAYIGCITLFLAATIAVVATDIKRVLAYSTISQLGYMMLAIGLGGWAAGLFHLITHAFFKSLMFLCSGSVIHGCHHVQEMPQMGGLWKKMPITAITMLVGVIAICGLAIPGIELSQFSALLAVGVIVWLVAVPLSRQRLLGAVLLAATAVVVGGAVLNYIPVSTAALCLAGLGVVATLAIAALSILDWRGAAIPLLLLLVAGATAFLWGPVAFSGYHSKDAIVATALTYSQLNGLHALLFVVPLAGAGITAFYMFRLWFYTFAGEPRDRHVYEHAHESPWVMTSPLILLAVFAAFVAIGGEQGPLFQMLLGSEPVGLAEGAAAGEGTHLAIPSHSQVHANHATAGRYALLVAFAGTLIAYLFYGARKFRLNPGEVQARFSGIYTFLVEKWRFDELYDVLFVMPVHIVSSWAAAIDRLVFDGFLHACARGAVQVSNWDRLFDESIVDGLVNWVGNVTYATGDVFRLLQTGRLRQYVMFIVIGVIIVGGAGLFWLLRLQGA